MRNSQLIHSIIELIQYTLRHKVQSWSIARLTLLQVGEEPRLRS